MPSLRLYDDDMNTAMIKHHEIDMKLSEFRSTLAAIVQEVRALQAARTPVSSRMIGGSEGVMSRYRQLIVRPLAMEIPLLTLLKLILLQNKPATARNWATVSSTPSQRDNRFTALSAEKLMKIVIVRCYRLFKVRRRAMKRLRQQSSPNTHSSQQHCSRGSRNVIRAIN